MIKRDSSRKSTLGLTVVSFFAQLLWCLQFLAHSRRSLFVAWFTVFFSAMHDLNYFREHLADFEQMAANRSARIDFDAFRVLDRERRERITAGERLKAERNRASEEIARRKRAGENADDLLAEMKRVSEDIKLADETIAEFGLPGVTRLLRYGAAGLPINCCVAV